MGKNKTAKFKYAPQTEKSARINPQHSNTEFERPSWVLSIMDIDGPWGWKIDANKMLEIRQTLSNYESMNWREILQNHNSGCHSIPTSKICKEAQVRLVELRQDDTDDLISLRKTGKERIWGIKDRDVLKILWWDPNHEVYPVEKKNT